MKRKNGYTLVEVLVAVAILCISIFPIISVFPAIVKSNSAAADMEEATRTASQIVEFVRAKKYARLVGTAATGNIQNAVATLGTSGGNIVLGPETLTTTGTSFTNNTFNTGLALNNNFILNGRRGFLSNCTIYLVLRNTQVRLGSITDAAVIGNELYRNFIIGRVVVGWAGTATGTAIKPTGREKEVSLQFVITPVE